MKYIKCPENYIPKAGETSLFLAGGITGCPPWQVVLRDYLKNTNLTLIDPRREHFDINNVSMARGQIIWERLHLVLADAVSFWFCKETLCPITLFELGYWLHSSKPIFVGVDPEYKRVFDIETQLAIETRGIPVVYNLEDLASEIEKQYD